MSNWFRITNQAGSGNPAVYLYEEIGAWGVTAADFTAQLREISAPGIDVHLNTPGGDLFDGLAIYNALKTHPARITTYVDSLAASAGSIIAMAGDRIIMAKNASIMIHDAMSVVCGNAADLRQSADLLDKASDNIASIYADRAGGSVAGWRQLMRAETWYDANEAVAAGLADQIGADASPTPATARLGAPVRNSISDAFAAKPAFGFVNSMAMVQRMERRGVPVPPALRARVESALPPGVTMSAVFASLRGRAAQGSRGWSAEIRAALRAYVVEVEVKRSVRAAFVKYFREQTIAAWRAGEDCRRWADMWIAALNS